MGILYSEYADTIIRHSVLYNRGVELKMRKFKYCWSGYMYLEKLISGARVRPCISM